MKPPFRYTCSCCGEIHEGAPSFSFAAPFYWSQLSEEEKAQGELTPDLCAVGEHRFIRVTLEIPIHGHAEAFLWGVWISVSQKNFERYVETFDEEIQEGKYFGWFNNRLPYYPETLNLKSVAVLRSHGQRPSLDLEPTDHPLSVDYREGIGWDRAIEIAEVAMHGAKKI